MSCFPEWVYSVYVDGELPSDEVRPLESHLVKCRECRALVLALEEEAGALATVLQEREAGRRIPAPSAAPVRGIALGALPALALGAVVLTVVGGILETRLPTSVDWLNPFRLTGAFDMAFDAIFLARDRAPQLFSLIVALAALGGVATLLTYAVTLLSRRWLGQETPQAFALGICSVALAIAPAPSQALELRHTDRVEIAKGETFDQTLIVSANVVVVEGVIEGDLVLLADRLVINGEVRGNVLGAVRSLELEGVVTGSLHVFGERIHVAGEVGHNVYSASDHYTLGEGGRIGGDATHGGAGITIAGEVGRDLFVGSEWVEIRGSVLRDADLRADRVSLVAGSRVGNDLDVLLLGDGDDADISPDAEIGGESNVAQFEHDPEAWLAEYLERGFYLWLGISLCASFAFGMVLHAMIPWLLRGQVETAGEFFRHMGVGFVAVVVTPFALLLLAITIAGIPIALMGVSVYLIGLYTSSIVIAALIGPGIISEAEDGGWSAFALPLLVGLVVVTLVTNIPILGGIAGIVVLLCGMGLIVERLRERWAE